MAKYKFFTRERESIWKAHGEKCAYCDRRIAWEDLEVDHIVPETLLDNPIELERIQTEYGLKSDFNINSYYNWLPSHKKCNRKKGSWRFNAQNTRYYIEMAGKQYDKINNLEKSLSRIHDRNKVLCSLDRAIESGSLSVHYVVQYIVNKHLPVLIPQYLQAIGNNFKVSSINIFDKLKGSCLNEGSRQILLVTRCRVGGIPVAILIEGFVYSNMKNTELVVSWVATFVSFS